MNHPRAPRLFRSSVSDDGTTVSLPGLALTSVPDWLEGFTDLTTLNLSDNHLFQLPEWLGNLTSLTTLDLGDNELMGLPSSLGNLTSLTDLILTNNKNIDLPTSLGGLSSLKTLMLGDNQLPNLPESIGSLTSLRTLDLSRNWLTELPRSLGNLTGLRSLSLSHNRLTTLPELLVNLISLTALYLNHNDLAILPEWLGDLTALRALDLRANKLSALPERLMNLTFLNELLLGDNQLTALPDSVGSLSELTNLNLERNQITSLPDSIGNLAALTRLNLLGNSLIALPDSIGNLTALTWLDLLSNRLAALPSSLGNLTSLARLDVRGNKLTTVPRQLAGPLAKGLQLDLDGNPLGHPLPVFLTRDADALATYLGSLDDAVTQYEAKLLLVGEGNVGKTSLVAALRGAPFVEGRPTTHGIEISPMKMSHPSFNQDMTLRAWDFGGQEVYRVTHQFFFSRRALYMVVWNARQGQDQDEVEGWLRRIRLRTGRDARAIVVATHCAERLPELDYPNLQQVFPEMLVGNFDVDSRNEAGIPELRKAIAVNAARLPQMGQMISHRWVAARDEILARAEAEPQILYLEFMEVCERCGVTGQEVVTLAELMHDLGYIIYYGDDLGLKEIIVLNPEWLTKAISYVLEDKATKDSGGILDHARLKEIWQDRDGGQVYPARYHAYFLRLMEKFDVSYRLEGDELHSLVAQLVPHERPILPWQPRTQPPAGIRMLALVCRLSEPVQGLIPWLTVRHHRASTGLHWRRGVFLRHPINAYASEALLELRHPRELAVEVRAPSPDLYFNVLRDSIEDLINRRWPGISDAYSLPWEGARWFNVRRPVPS